MIQLPYGVKYFGQNSLFLPTFSVFLPRFLVISNRKPLILPRFRSIFSKFFQNLWILKTSYFKRGYQNVQINRGHLRQGSGGEIFRFNLGRPNPDRHYGWFIILGKFGLFWNILQQFRELWIFLKHFPTISGIVDYSETFYNNFGDCGLFWNIFQQNRNGSKQPCTSDVAWTPLRSRSKLNGIPITWAMLLLTTSRSPTVTSPFPPLIRVPQTTSCAERRLHASPRNSCAITLTSVVMEVMKVIVILMTTLTGKSKFKQYNPKILNVWVRGLASMENETLHVRGFIWLQVFKITFPT